MDGKITDDHGYYQGFCNDKYCGFCFNYIQCLKNGVSVPGYTRHYDRYGCEHCENKNIAMDLYLENKEGDIDFLMKFHKDHLEEIRPLAETYS